MYDAKSVFVTLARVIGVSLPTCCDPKVADWLKQPGARAKTLHRMVASYTPGELPLLDGKSVVYTTWEFNSS